MSWDPVWEEIFSSRDWGKYPPEELIRFIARNFYSAADRKQVKILELGCGTGANMWFLAREGFDVFGIDGSKTAIDKANKRLGKDGLYATLEVGDIIRLSDLYPRLFFDAVVDVGCLQCNHVAAIKTILECVRLILKPGGRVFSITVADGSWGDGLGEEVEPGTFINIKDGPLHGRGLNHFLNIDEIKQMFNLFEDLQIEYSARSFNNREHIYKNWVIQGRKTE